MDLWHSSAPCGHSFGLENTYHCVYHELLLLQDHIPIYKLHIGAQEENTLILLLAFWVSGQEDVSIVHIRGSTPVCQIIQKLSSCPVPGCPNLVARTKNMFNIMDQVLPLTCWVLTVRVICPILLEESLPVTVYTVGEGEEEIPLLDLQNFI